MCFNITFKGFVLSCCSNGTYYPEGDIWTRERLPACDALDPNVAPKDVPSDASDFLISGGIVIFFLACLVAFVVLRKCC